MAGLATLGSAALAELIRPGLVRPASDPDAAGRHRMLPVLPELSWLLPGRGLRRGTTVAVAAGQPLGGAGGVAQPGGASLVLALIAEASRSGSWCAVVGVPTFGALAAADAGIALDRLEAGGFADSCPVWAGNPHQVSAPVRCSARVRGILGGRSGCRAGAPSVRGRGG